MSHHVSERGPAQGLRRSLDGTLTSLSAKAHDFARFVERVVLVAGARPIELVAAGKFELAG